MVSTEFLIAIVAIYINISNLIHYYRLYRQREWTKTVVRRVMTRENGMRENLSEEIRRCRARLDELENDLNEDGDGLKDRVSDLTVDVNRLAQRGIPWTVRIEDDLND